MNKKFKLEMLREVLRCGDTPGAPTDSVDGLIDMVEVVKPQTVLEIGSGRGVSTEVFLLQCKHVVSVDPYDRIKDLLNCDYALATRWRTAFETRCRSYPNLTTIRDFSPRALLKMIPGYAGYFDLVYVDGDHAYAAAVADIRASWPLVREGGWIAGHDYLHPNNTENVVRAVDDLFGPENVKVFSDTSWIVPRPATQP